MLNACQPFNTLCAERFLNQTTVLHHPCFLKVGPKFAFGRIHRETSSMSERSRLTTVLTPSHRVNILSRKKKIKLNKRTESYHMSESSSNLFGKQF